MKQELLSVIIPVYNAERYLNKSIESVLNQTYGNLEIILVDDGSIDNSAALCSAYAQKDERVIFVEQENRGVAVARRTGSRLATGKYITFVDSDDYIDYDLYEKLMPLMKLVDIVTSGYYIGEKKFYDSIEIGIYKTNAEMEYLYKNMIYMEDGYERGLTSYIVNKIFLTDIAKNVFCDISENIFIGEDSEFLYRYLLKCQSCCVTNECGYHYVMNENSALHSVNKNFLQNVNALYHSLEEVFMASEYQKSLMLQLGKMIQSLLGMTYMFLGFERFNQNIIYVYPFMEMILDKSFILYGAGKVGKDYWNLLKKMDGTENVTWVDKNWKNYNLKIFPINPIEKIMDINYDYILLAVAKKELANEIKEELLLMGVKEEKILWKEPISTFLL